MRCGRAGGLACGACWLLLLMLVADAAALVKPVEQIAPEICPTIDIRSSPEQMNKLRGCRVIEGQLNIVLIERAKPRAFENMSFPELREVTGYINIYRLRGVRNLGDLFPNLTVVRGMQLFKDYSIIIFDNEHLEELGLRSLAKVERGLVRIENNDHLCYTDTIDWGQIVANGYADDNIIRANYDPRLCGLCPNSQSRIEDRRQPRYCPVDTTGKILCWDEKHCQKVCPSTCGERACSKNLTCCHPTCLGGCDGPTAMDCDACKNFSLGYLEQRKCVERCPAGFYQLFRRCVTEQECRAMQPPQLLGSTSQKNIPAPKIPYYKLLNNYRCVYVCPSGYIEKGDARNATCEPCPASGCRRDCRGDAIDSIQAAEQFRGCTHIQGTLEISLRTGGVNTMSVLEDSLGEIQEIDGALRVTRSYPLVSLMFLKNLERIVGINDTNNRNHSLYIFNNANLELLWDWSVKKPVEITRGGVFIHFNPKLCYNQVLPIKNMTKDPRATFTEYDVNNNGDQGSCLQDKLHLRVHILKSTAAILTWDMYCVEDIRKLLGYSIYYIQAETNVTLYGQRDACSDTWNVLDKTVEEVRNNTDYPISKNGIIMNNCDMVQPLFYPVTQLTPYTRYAAYVKTYTTYQDKDGAQSPIIYFRTLPGSPSPPQGLTVEPLTPNTVYIKWSPPSMPNGTIILYHVEILQNSYNQPNILASNINHCGTPSILANKIALHNEEKTEKHEEEEKDTGDVKDETCACEREDRRPVTRFSSRVEAERAETILFENDLQNSVYIRSPERKKNFLNRTRRSIDDDLNSMLVIVGKNTGPSTGFNYTNRTDEEVKCSHSAPKVCVETDSTGYAKNLYYELSGKTRSIVVEHMRHFTWYTVYIWACREKHPNETIDGYNASWCSARDLHTFLTMEMPNADRVSNVRAEIVVSNKTVPEVNVTWDPPKHPNGFVLAYNVHHSLVDSNIQAQDVGLQTCVTADDYEANGRGHVMRQLAPGNYSIRITPITVSGAGNVSQAVYVFIPERTAEAGYEWVWGLICGCVIMLLVLGVGVWYARRSLLASAETNKLFASVNPEYVSTVYVPDEWEVPRANIEIIRELGQGSFGMVYEGLAKNLEKGKPETRCAVKTVNEHATDRERIEFLNEASVMKAFDTHHVVRLMGVVSRGQPTFVVMELMELGDLKTYLRSHRPDNDNSLPKKDPAGAPPTLDNILQMAIEIADGMAYLSAKKYVHRDLAARNCMVAGDLTVKVGDFGMTRDIYETDYYRKGTKGLLPVRWMSPESLKDGVFSSSSDIWSYGVVLWEMATLAMQPYQGLSNEQVVRYVVEGGVMERPEQCPDRLYELMRACWVHRASARPAFLQLVAELANTAQPYFRQRSFFHTPMGQELYALQRANSAGSEEAEGGEAMVGALATGSGLFGVSGRLPSWVRELSLRSRASPDAAAEPLQPRPGKPPPNGRIHTTPC